MKKRIFGISGSREVGSHTPSNIANLTPSVALSQQEINEKFNHNLEKAVLPHCLKMRELHRNAYNAIGLKDFSDIKRMDSQVLNKLNDDLKPIRDQVFTEAYGRLLVKNFNPTDPNQNIDDLRKSIAHEANYIEQKIYYRTHEEALNEKQVLSELNKIFDEVNSEVEISIGTHPDIDEITVSNKPGASTITASQSYMSVHSDEKNEYIFESEIYDIKPSDINFYFEYNLVDDQIQPIDLDQKNA